MKYLSMAIVLIVWILATIILGVIVIPLQLAADYGWFDVPKDLLKDFNK